MFVGNSNVVSLTCYGGSIGFFVFASSVLGDQEKVIIINSLLNLTEFLISMLRLVFSRVVVKEKKTSSSHCQFILLFQHIRDMCSEFRRIPSPVNFLLSRI